MSVGTRLREERARLALSQTDFAALAGAKKGTQISWEKDASSPTAQALVAFAEAGADVLYILTGRRTGASPLDLAPYVEAQLAAVSRDVLEPGRKAQPNETLEQTEKRLLDWHANALSNILQHDTQLLPPNLSAQAAELLEVVTDAERRAAYRIAHFAEQRTRRQAAKREVASHLNMTPYNPSETVRSMLADIVLEHGVPTRVVVRLIEQLLDEAAATDLRNLGVMERRR